MKNIIVVDLLKSPVLLSAEKGELLFEAIKKALKSKTKGKVVINFEGYRFMSSTFLNNAFGQLCIDLNFSEKNIKDKLEISGLNSDDEDDLELAVSNAQLRKRLIEDNVNVQEFYASFMNY